jgi:hypothetical protein
LRGSLSKGAGGKQDGDCYFFHQGHLLSEAQGFIIPLDQKKTNQGDA